MMKSMQSCVQKPLFFAVCVVAQLLAAGVSPCDAQFGYFGRGTTVARGAFKYRGPILSIQVGPAYPASPWIGGYDPVLGASRYGSAFGASPYDWYGLNNTSSTFSSSAYDRYRGIQPTQAELDRERFYQNLDRTHRYTTREERYGNDFYNAYASPSAMVNRYRDPYVAGTSALPWTPLPVPGLTQNRHDSSYQGYVPDDQVAVSLRAAANRLTRGLTRKADGHIWIRHLQPQQIIDAIDRGDDPASLADLLVNYHGVADSPRLVLIAEAEGFKDVRRLLAQYVTLSSPYPNVQGTEIESWQPPASDGQETILEERVIGEQVIGENETMLDPPSLPLSQQPSFDPSPIMESPNAEIRMQETPIERSEIKSEVPASETLNGTPKTEERERPMIDKPRLDSLPDDADVELLPAPVPMPIES